MSHRTDLRFAESLDGEDALAPVRGEFEIPKGPDGVPVAYMCGNSLGVMPRAARDAVVQELDDWSSLGVDGHLQAQNPWYPYHEQFREVGAHLVGARPGEVVMMNTLSVNLHLLMASLYQPTGSRTRILIEDHAFPSDRYAVQTHVAWHGLDPDHEVIEVSPEGDGPCLTTDDVLAALDRHGDEVALMLLGGVNYFTGQWFDIPTLTAEAHARGCMVGWDLAHAAGNVPLALHEWDVDFAAWCSYKYLNAGPGAVGGAFVHERHGQNPELVRLAGWWGNDPETRFQMHLNRRFVPRSGADGWQISNPPIFSLAPLRVSLEIFEMAGMAALRAKSLRLTGYLETLINDLPGERFSLITPTDPERRGCQLSIRVQGSEPKRLFAALTDAGVVGDFREPDVIRLAPVPLYNSFGDVWRVANALSIAVGAGPLPESPG